MNRFRDRLRDGVGIQIEMGLESDSGIDLHV